MLQHDKNKSPFLFREALSGTFTPPISIGGGLKSTIELDFPNSFQLVATAGRGSASTASVTLAGIPGRHHIITFITGSWLKVTGGRGATISIRQNNSSGPILFHQILGELANVSSFFATNTFIIAEVGVPIVLYISHGTGTTDGSLSAYCKGFTADA